VGTLPHLAEALSLVAVTVSIHATGSLGILWCLTRYRETGERHFGYVHNTALLSSLVVAVICLHCVEVSCWAAFYAANQCFPELRTALYFSLNTFSTVGYGDVVLNEEWRLLGGLEAMTGMMMVSWSTVLLLGLSSRMTSRRVASWSGHREKASAGSTEERSPAA
jgi:hypothetical protein